MIDSNNLKVDIISYPNVSRETMGELDDFSDEILNMNKQINLISRSTEKSIKSRHIIDSAQTIDFIDKKDIVMCTDIGSGAGLPGIVLGILMKPRNPMFKVIFYEKSHHKSHFLEKMSKKFKLNYEIQKKNIFEEENLETDVIISRAFKPLPVMFEIAINNFKNFKYIIIFLGRGGKKILNDALKFWNFNYEKRKSLTSDESIVVKISNLKKKCIKK